MSGVISALESLKRPCNVVVSTPRWALQEEFRTTDLDFRERMEKLAKVHRILYVYAEQDTDVLVRCRTAAEEAINQYRRACLVAVPLTRILEKAFVCFGIPMTERVEVSEPQQGRGEEGGRSEAEEKKGSWNLIIAETEYGKVKSYGKRRHDGTKSDN